MPTLADMYKNQPDPLGESTAPAKGATLADAYGDQSDPLNPESGTGMAAPGRVVGPNKCGTYVRKVAQASGWEGRSIYDISNPKYGTPVDIFNIPDGAILHLKRDPSKPATTEHWAIKYTDSHGKPMLNEQQTVKGRAIVTTNRPLSDVQHRITGAWAPKLTVKASWVDSLQRQPSVDDMVASVTTDIGKAIAPKVKPSKKNPSKTEWVQSLTHERAPQTLVNVADEPLKVAHESAGTRAMRNAGLELRQMPAQVSDPTLDKIADIALRDPQAAREILALRHINGADANADAAYIEQRMADLSALSEPSGRDVMIAGLAAGMPIPGVAAIEKAGIGAVERATANQALRIAGKTAVRGATGAAEGLAFNAVATAPELVTDPAKWWAEQKAGAPGAMVLGGLGRAVIGPMLGKVSRLTAERAKRLQEHIDEQVSAGKLDAAIDKAVKGNKNGSLNDIRMVLEESPEFRDLDASAKADILRDIHKRMRTGEVQKSAQTTARRAPASTPEPQGPPAELPTIDPTPATPARVIDPGVTDAAIAQAQTQLAEMGYDVPSPAPVQPTNAFVHVPDHPEWGSLTIVDDTDPSMLMLQTEAGGTIKIGRGIPIAEGPAPAIAAAPVEATPKKSMRERRDEAIAASEANAGKFTTSAPTPIAPEETPVWDKTQPLYHGTPNDFDGKPSPSTAPQWGEGVYLATDPKAPTEVHGWQGRVLEYRADIDKPLIEGSPAYNQIVKDLEAESHAHIDRLDQRVQANPDDTEAWKELDKAVLFDSSEPEGAVAINKRARELGYDAIIGNDPKYGKEVVVFDNSKLLTPDEYASKYKTDTLESTAPAAPTPPKTRLPHEVEKEFVNGWESGDDQANPHIPSSTLGDAYALGVYAKANNLTGLVRKTRGYTWAIGEDTYRVDSGVVTSATAREAITGEAPAPAKAPADGPPAFETLHPNSQKKFDAAWDARNADDMNALLDPMNKGLRAEFERRSGVKLPSTIKGTRAAVESHFAKASEPAASEPVGVGGLIEVDGKMFRVDRFSPSGERVHLVPTGDPYPVGRVMDRDVLERKTGTTFDVPDAAQAPVAKEPEQTKITVDSEGKLDTVALAESFAPLVESDSPVSIAAVKDHVAAVTGINQGLMGRTKSAGILDWKAVEEAYEYALVRYLHEIATDKNLSPQERWEAVKRVYRNQPNLSSRDSNSRTNQQYSTPAPIAWAMQEYLGLDKGRAVYEPTAGNGMLVAMADPSRVHVNELDPGYRLANLNDYGFGRVTNENALGLPSRHSIEGNYKAVIMNPPFGGAPAKVYPTHDGGRYKIVKIEHQIVLDSLRAMADDGRAAIIIGGHNFENPFGKPQEMTAADRVFFNYLYSAYNVTHNVDVAGNLYSKMGTDFPIRVITVDGRRSAFTKTLAPENVTQVEQASTFDDLRGILRTGNEVISDAASDTMVGEPNLQGIKEPGRGGSPKRPASSAGGSAVSPRRASDAEPSGNGKGDSVTPGGEHSRSDVSGGDVGELPVVHENDQSETSKPDASRRRAGRSDIPAQRQHAVADEQNAFQSTYKAHSKGTSVGTRLLPTKLVQPIASSLARIADIHGDLDKWVAKELGYPTTKALFEALANIQIDAVALAIHSMQTGTAAIIGDQTGVGKGRVAAALMLYAKKQGRVPVFLTANPNLFSDIYRDIADIKDKVTNPLILGDPSRGANIVDEDGNLIFSAGAGSAVSKINKYRANPKSYDYVMAPYTQFSKPGAQQDFLKEIAQNALLVMDEAHLAAGESTRGLFFRYDVLARVPDVVYLSATYAKRPDAFPLYWRTALGAGIDRAQMLARSGEAPATNAYGKEDDTNAASTTLDALISAIEKGGVPFQEWAAMELAKAGNYIRREPDFKETKGVRIEIDESHAKECVERADKIRDILRDIVAFDVEKNKYVADINATKKDIGKRISGESRTSAGASSTSFGSRIHNFISQLLLASKADFTVEQVLQAVKEGKKPVIALSNTMETFLKDFASTSGVELDQPIDLKYEYTLQKALESTLKMTETDHDGTRKSVKIDVADLPSEAQNIYRGIQQDIDMLDTGLPASFIDYVTAKLEAAGLRVGEITGRQTQIRYNADGSTSYVARKEGAKDRKGVVRNFNNGEVDVVFLNTAGATGISMHNAPKFKDHRERTMLIVQPELNIDIEIQKLGRIFRYMGLLDWEGVDVRPSYVYLLSALSSEMRPAVVNQRKLKAMNANTSANAKSAFNLDNIPDIMNAVGDRIVAEYFARADNASAIYDFLGEKLHMEREAWLGRSQKERRSALDGIEDLAAKATGRISLLPEAESSKHLEAIEEAFTQEIARLDELDENPLVSKTYNWDAITKRKSLVAPGTNNDNAFTADMTIEELSVKSEFKAFNAAKVNAEIARRLKGRTPDEAQAAGLKRSEDIYNKQMATLRKRYAAAKKKLDASDTKTNQEKVASIERQADTLTRDYQFYRDVIDKMKVGNTFEHDGRIERVIGLQIKEPDTKGGYAFSPSKLIVTLASTKDMAVVTPYWSHSKLSDYEPIEFTDEEWTEAIASNDERDTKYVITGNLTKAFDLDAKGSIINYKSREGELVPAFLLAKDVSSTKIAKLFSSRMGKPSEVAAHVKGLPLGETLTSIEGTVTLSFEVDGYHVSVPAAKAKGGNIWGDYATRYMIDRQKWFQNGRQMEATVPAARIEQFLERLREFNGVEFILDNQKSAGDTYGVTDYASAGERAPRATAPESAVMDGEDPGPIQEREVAQILVDATGQLHRQGRMGATRARGLLKERAGISRAKNIYDIPTAAHEFGHGLGARFGWNKDPDLLAELAPFADPAGLGEYSSLEEGDSQEKELREAIGEFVRYYITDPHTAISEAPEFHQTFENALADEGMLQAFITARHRYAQYMSQGGVNKMRGATDYKNTLAKKIEKQPRFHGLRTDIFDENFPIRKMVEDIYGTRYEDIAPSKNPYVLKRNAAGAIEYADQMIMDGDGDVPGLKEALALSGDKSKGARDIQDYWIARRLDLLHKAGKATGAMTPDEIDDVIDQFDSPEFQASWDAIQEYQSHVLDLASDFHTPAARREWEKVGGYIPLNRVVEHGIGETRESAGGIGAGKGMANQNVTFHAYKGRSHALYIPPVDSIITNTYKIVQRAAQNDAMKAFVDMIKAHPDDSQVLERIPPTSLPIEVGAMFKAALEQMENGEDIIAALPDEVFDLEYWKQLGLTGKMKNARIIFCMRKGNPEFYQVRDKILYDALVAVPAKQMTMLMQVLSMPARAIRFGVTWDPGFLLYTNLIRDSLHAFMVTPGYVPFVDTVRGAKSALSNGDSRMALIKHGGGMSTSVALDRGEVRKKSRNVVVAATASDRAHAVGENIVQEAYDFKENSELANRIAVFDRELAAVKAKHPDWSEEDQLAMAAFRSRDLLDFAMRGRLTAEATQGIAFARSKLNGIAKMGHEIHRNPWRILLAGGVLALATATLYYLNRRDPAYKALDEYERANYWHIKWPGTTGFQRIPKPQEWGLIFGTTIEDTLRMIDGDPTAFGGWPDAASSVTSMDLPNGLQLAIDLASNRQSYSGAPIAPDYLVTGKSAVRPEDQYSSSTSPGFKVAGRLLHASPAKLEYAATQLGGPSAQYVIGLMDWAISPLTGEMPRKSPNPMSRVMTRVTPYPAAYSELRDKESQLRQDLNSIHQQKTEAKQNAYAIQLGYRSAQEVIYKVGRLSEAITNLRVIEKTFYAPNMTPERRERARNALQTMSTAALNSVGYPAPMQTDFRKSHRRR